jgi:hypothetical protein
LERTRELAQAELDAITQRKERVEELEMNRDVLLESLAKMIPEALDTLEPEERSRIYRMLQLEIIPGPQGFRISGALDEAFVQQERHLPVGPVGQNIVFRAPLTESGAERLESASA